MSNITCTQCEAVASEQKVEYIPTLVKIDERTYKCETCLRLIGIYEEEQ